MLTLHRRRCLFHHAVKYWKADSSSEHESCVILVWSTIENVEGDIVMSAGATIGNGTTIKKRVSMVGIGLHSGADVCLTLVPSDAEGIVFIRTDVGKVIPADADHVVSTRLSTTLGVDGVEVGTVEHLLSAVYAFGINRLTVELDGPEVPIGDGSALPFVALLQEAGMASSACERPSPIPIAPITVTEGRGRIAFQPATEGPFDERLDITCKIAFDHPVIGEQSFVYRHSPQAFIREIAPARTFCMERDVVRMRAQGLARGGSLQNAIVVGESGVLNPEGLRFHDEFVRHKILDLLGDLALLGRPLVGQLETERAGHHLHGKFVRRILEETLVARG